MLLEGKVAIVYGAGGPVGGAVSRAFALEGARVFLAGRSEAPLARLAAEIRAAGGAAVPAVVDALDERRVEELVGAVVERAGRLDVSFNLISLGDVQRPLAELSLEDFLRPVETAMRSHFLTARAAARHMVRQGPA